MQSGVGKPHCVFNPFLGVAVKLVLTPVVDRKHSAIAVQYGNLAGIAAVPAPHMCECRVKGQGIQTTCIVVHCLANHFLCVFDALDSLF